MTVESKRLPLHRRVANPPRMRLTGRDMQVIHAVQECRILRRDQIQQLFFPSQNTANERLQRLYQHGYLERRWCPVEYGHGSGQAVYLLARRGARLLAENAVDGNPVVHCPQANRTVRSPFLEHMMAVNDVRIAFRGATARAGYRIERWDREDQLKAAREYVYTASASKREQTAAIIPDAYFVLNLRTRRAHFFLELDRATETSRRWRERVRAYLSYVASGRYSHRFGTRSLRILVVTTSSDRLSNLKRTTERAGGQDLFWLSTMREAAPASILAHPVWRVAGREGQVELIDEQLVRGQRKSAIQSRTS